MEGTGWRVRWQFKIGISGFRGFSPRAQSVGCAVCPPDGRWISAVPRGWLSIRRIHLSCMRAARRRARCCRNDDCLALKCICRAVATLQQSNILTPSACAPSLLPMHKNLVLLLAAQLLLPLTASAAEADVPYDAHDGYFVSNKFEAAAPTSFVLIKDQDGFDQVFGTAMVMGDKSHRLPPNAFANNKIVVAAIHRGQAMVKYQVKSVTAADQTLIVRYTTTVEPHTTAKFSCPLIMSLDKGDYSTVRFVENGKVVKRLTVEPPPAVKPNPNL